MLISANNYIEAECIAENSSSSKRSNSSVNIPKLTLKKIPNSEATWAGTRQASSH